MASVRGVTGSDIMKVLLREGPAFGALIIGCGLAFVMNSKGFPLWQALGAGIALGLADYAFIILIQERFRK